MNSIEKNNDIVLLDSLEDAQSYAQILVDTEVAILEKSGYETIAFPEILVPGDMIIVESVMRKVLHSDITPFQVPTQKRIPVQETRPVILGDRLDASKWDISGSEQVRYGNTVMIPRASRVTFLTEEEITNLQIIEGKCFRKTIKETDPVDDEVVRSKVEGVL